MEDYESKYHQDEDDSEEEEEEERKDLVQQEQDDEGDFRKLPVRRNSAAIKSDFSENTKKSIDFHMKDNEDDDDNDNDNDLTGNLSNSSRNYGKDRSQIKRKIKKKKNTELDRILNDLYHDAEESSRNFARESEDYLASLRINASLKDVAPSVLEKLCLFALYVNVKISEGIKANLNIVQILQNIEHGRDLKRRRDTAIQGKRNTTTTTTTTTNVEESKSSTEKRHSILGINDNNLKKKEKAKTMKYCDNLDFIKNLIDKEKSNIQSLEEEMGIFWESKIDRGDEMSPMGVGADTAAPESSIEISDGETFYSRCANNDTTREMEQLLSSVLLVSSVRSLDHKYKRHRRHFHHDHSSPKQQRHHHHHHRRRNLHQSKNKGDPADSTPLAVVYPQWRSPEHLYDEQPQKFPVRVALAQLEGMMKLIMPSKRVFEDGQSFDIVRKKILQLSGLLRTKNKQIVDTRHDVNKWKSKLLKLFAKRDFLRAKFLKMYPAFWQELPFEDRDYLNTLATDVSLNQDWISKLASMREQNEINDEKAGADDDDDNSSDSSH